MADVLDRYIDFELLPIPHNSGNGKRQIKERIAYQHSTLRAAGDVDRARHQSVEYAFNVKADLVETFFIAANNEFRLRLVSGIQRIHIIGGSRLRGLPNTAYRLGVQLRS